MYKIIGGDQKEYGPISADQVRQWLAEGRLSGQSQICAEGTSDWKPLSHFPEFALSTQAAPTQAGVVVSSPPASIKVFGILNIVFGSMGLLCAPLALLGNVIKAPQQQAMHPPPLAEAWTMIAVIVGILCAIVQIASGIGLCRHRAWGRKAAVYLSVFSLIFNAIGTVLMIVVYSDPSVEQTLRMFGIFGAIMGMVMALIYNGLLIFFLTKPRVKEVLGETV